MRLAVNILEQRGDLMSFQDECIMAAKYMMEKKSSGHKDIDYFYDEDSPYGFKLAQAWDIGDGVYLGFTDYRYIIDSTTHNNCVKWSYGTKSITYTDSDGTTKSRSFEGYIYERYYYSYMCFGSTDNIDGQPWMITTDLPDVVEIMKQTRVMDADGYIYADIYNLRQLDPSANIVMTPRVYTNYTKRDLAEYYIPDKRKPRMYYTSSILNPHYGVDDEHIGIVTYNYAAASRGYINIRSETKPDNDDAKKDEFGTWTVKIEIKPPDNPIYNSWIDIEGIGYGWLWVNHKDSERLQRKSIIKFAMDLYKRSKNEMCVRSDNSITDIFLESKDGDCIFHIRVSNNELDCW